jgi:hypothetical protein
LVRRPEVQKHTEKLCRPDLNALESYRDVRRNHHR